MNSEFKESVEQPFASPVLVLVEYQNTIFDSLTIKMDGVDWNPFNANLK
jgi:hypothetical protein